MGKVKHLMQEDMVNDIYTVVPNHLNEEMHEEMIKIRQQVTAIKLILEECK
tara:strand:- start:4 stop:156 length:153 start_codon:yes stop_codon:yes gene_type:complete